MRRSARRKRTAAATAALLMTLAACQQSGNGRPAPSPEPNATPTDAAPGPSPSAAPTGQGVPVSSLAGEWRVAGIDGEEVAGDMGLALSADAGRIWWTPVCAGFSVGYRIDGLAFRIPQPAPSVSPSAQPQVVCAIGIPLELVRAWQALTAADRIERLPNNGVLLSGGGRSLLLFSQ